MFLELNYRSAALNKQTQVNILIPDVGENDTLPYKVLWLFHGLAGNHTVWMRNTSIERYAAKHRLAVVMPNVDRSWYTDTAYDAKYFTFVTEELPTLCFDTFRTLSQRREDNIVAGLSMGGYGAVKAAFTYPEKYGACITLSGALDVTRKGRPTNLNEWRRIFGFDLESPLALEGSKHDIFALTKKAKSEGAPLPRLYAWCGTEDTLLPINRAFDEHLSSLGIPHLYEESEGDHSWKWWDLHIAPALSWILTE